MILLDFFIGFVIGCAFGVCLTMWLRKEPDFVYYGGGDYYMESIATVKQRKAPVVLTILNGGKNSE